MYAVGGSDGAHSLNSTEIYDPTTQNWTPGPSLTTSRANVGVAVIGNRLYAVGGFSGGLSYLMQRFLHLVNFFLKWIHVFMLMLILWNIELKSR